MSKTIVITGCSSGFGRVTALHLARNGWRVFATVRSEADQASLLVEAMAQGLHERLTPVLCDITDEAHVQGLARTVSEATSRLDALLNNAGTAYPAPVELLSLDDLRAQFEVNVVAQVAVTQALLPLLKAARGMIINVSSQGGRVAFPLLGPYHASKFALEAMSDSMRVELAPFGVRVVVVEPGSSPTAIWETSLQRALQGLTRRGVDASAYQLLIDSVRRGFVSLAKNGFPPQKFADLVLKILNTPHPRARYALPLRARLTMAARRFMPDEMWDRIVRQVLKW